MLCTVGQMGEAWGPSCCFGNREALGKQSTSIDVLALLRYYGGTDIFGLGPIGSPEMSVDNYQSTLPNNLEEWRPQLQREGSSKPCKSIFFVLQRAVAFNTGTGLLRQSTSWTKFVAWIKISKEFSEFIRFDEFIHVVNANFSMIVGYCMDCRVWCITVVGFCPRCRIQIVCGAAVIFLLLDDADLRRNLQFLSPCQMGTGVKATCVWNSSYITSGADKIAWSSTPLLYIRTFLWRSALL
jgi:hypothetical protein